MTARNRKDEPVLPRGKSSDVKPKITELDRKIGHNSFIYIHDLFIDRDEPYHLVYQLIRDMERIGDTSAEGGSRTGQFFAADFSINGSAAL